MAKPQSEAPIRLPSAAQVKALLKEGARVKERVGEIAGTYGDRVKSAIENGNLHGAAFGKAKSIFNKGRTNELAALEQIHHLRVYLDWIEEDISNKGHTGNLADMANAAEGEAKTEQVPAAETAPGGVPLADAQKMFEGTKAIADNRKAAAKKLDIPALDPDAPPAPPAPPAATEAAPAEKPKRGRPPKAAAAKPDVAPAPPAVGGLPDDDEEDTKPGAAEPRSRAAGTFSVVH